jgi:Flp pilus assembly protein TadD
MTLSAMRGLRRGLVLAATGIIFAAGPVRAQDADDPAPEPQNSRLPPGAVVQPLDTGPGAELRRNLMALSENPRSLEALIGAGRAAIGLRDGEAASGFFTRAQEIAPDDPRVRAGLGSAMLFSARPEQALILFAEAVQRGAPESEIAGDRGLAYDMVGDPRHAQQDYALALRGHDDPEIERRLALSLAISGQRQAALRAIDGQLRRRDRAAWRTQAFVLALTGDPAGADDTARRMMPAVNAEAMSPFFARLASLSPAQKAAAANFGRIPADGRTATTQVASNVDTRADPGALAMAEGGPQPRRFGPPLADPVNAARRRPGASDPRGDGGIAPPVQPQRRTELAQAQPPHRFQATPPPDPDDEDQADDNRQAQQAPPQRGAVARPREAPAFVPGGNFTLDSSREEASPPPPPAPVPAPGAAPGFGSVGQVQSPSVRQFQLTPSASAPAGRLSDVASTVQTLPGEGNRGSPASPQALTPAERQARDAAAREAEARYRAQGGSAASRTATAGGGHYWVQIAHGSERGALPLQYRQVHAQAPGLIESRNAWTAADRTTNRLLLGPFETSRAAQDYIAQLGARQIAAIPWESGAGQSVERLQGGGASVAPSSSRTRAAPPEPRPAPASHASRGRQAEARDASDDESRTAHGRSRRDRSAADDRASAHGRSGRDSADSDDRGTTHGRSGRNHSASDDRAGAHGRSGRDRSASDERSGSHGRSGRDRSDDRDNSHSRSRGHADADDRNISHGRSSSRRGSNDDDRTPAHGRSAHGRAAADDDNHSSRNRSSQERRQSAHDTRTSRGRSSEEQRPAPHGRRSH